jgi:hypothetical protein
MKTFKKISLSVAVAMSLSFVAHAAPESLRLPVEEIRVAARAMFLGLGEDLGEKKSLGEQSHGMKATAVETTPGVDLAVPELDADMRAAPLQ